MESGVQTGRDRAHPQEGQSDGDLNYDLEYEKRSREHR